ncbi:MAG: thiol:disulfide interchange protein [Limisphaerales bacterium]|jgi:thiol:disulfide interchange protein
MMRIFRCLPCLLVFTLFFSAYASGQMLDPVAWEFSAEPTEEGTIELVMKASIDEGWKIYGPDDVGGPIPTSVTIDSVAGVEWLTDWKMVGRKETKVDEFFGVEVTSFKKKAILRRTLKVNSPIKLKGFVEYMACDATQCLPPTEVEFVLNLAPKGVDAGSATGGILEPVKWQSSAEKIGEGEYLLKFSATIDEGWKLYSQHIEEAEIRPVPTSFLFDALPEGVELIGETEESGEVYEAEEPLFDNMVIRWFKHEAVFTQKVKAKAGDKIAGSIEYMTCDAGKCIKPISDPVFNIDLEKGVNLLADGADYVDKSECKDLVISGVKGVGGNESKNKSGILIFLLGVGGGFLALLTPCVFPMIPMTVSFFTKSSKDRATGIRNAVTYGLAITAIYGLCAVPFWSGLVPGDWLNGIATNPGLNILFFVIFLFFAFSFWGFYELSVPSSLTNRADSASSRGGLIGIIFMAVTLALVSFSCTGPILGAFMVGVLSGSSAPINVLYVMLGFGFGLGLPFGLFALFPSWLNSLPKSGGWMDSVKKTLGFLEFGLAFKFLSNADLVMQWGFIKRETFLIIWALVSLSIAIFLLGRLKLPHHIPVRSFSPVRIGMILISLFGAGYFAYGASGANLSAISGFPPPMFYSFAAEAKSRRIAANPDEKPVEVYHDGVIYIVDGQSIYERDSKKGISNTALSELIMEAKHDQEHCPNGIPCFHDYETAVGYAKLVDKPLHLDFTGWACVNCRKMEENVWVDPEVEGLLTNDFVLVSLYVDEKKKLPKEEQFVSCKFNNTIKTVGNKWSNLQAVNFDANAQPYYVLLTPDEKMLNEPTGFTSKDKYLDFLKTGLTNYTGKTTAIH